MTTHTLKVLTKYVALSISRVRVGNLFALADAMRMNPRDLVEKVEEDE